MNQFALDLQPQEPSYRKIYTDLPRRYKGVYWKPEYQNWRVVLPSPYPPLRRSFSNYDEAHAAYMAGGGNYIEAADLKLRTSLDGIDVGTIPIGRRAIPLTQGQFTTIDESEYEYTIQWKWFAQWSECTQSFYAVRQIKVGIGKQATLRMAQHIMGVNHSVLVDHVNHKTLDNWRDNLRVANKLQNAQNAKRRKDNSSGVKGVGWDPEAELWRARIRVDGKRIHLGRFEKLEDAQEAYRKASVKYHQDFGCYD